LSIRRTLYNQRHKLKEKGWKKILQACRNQKQAGVTIVISDKADFKQKSSELIKKVTTY
jgi:hypothetical protein